MLVVNLKSLGLVSSCVIRSLTEIPAAICIQLLQHLGVSSEEKLHHCERGRVAFFLRIVPLGRTGLGLNALRKCCVATFVLMRVVLVLWSSSHWGHLRAMVILALWSSRLALTHRRPQFIMFSLWHNMDYCFNLFRFIQLCLFFRRCLFPRSPE